MDDYNVNVLSEAKNEYSSRLLNIVTPLIILGIKSIFSEAVDLCIDNNEEEKYLMTFQNFLSRVPKWNANIIKEEVNRIINDSNCPYLEDLLTCVHITQLKILTSIRVSNQQKKIEIDIPKLDDFIHNVYINFARKLYANIYLFEKDIMPLNYQKNMREAELLCRECILKVIRDSMPIEQILRAYMDETIHDEIIEETLEKQVTEDEAIDMIEEAKKNNENSEKDIEVNKVDVVDKDHEISVEEPKLLTNNEIANDVIKEVADSIISDKSKAAEAIAAVAPTVAPAIAAVAPTVAPAIAAVAPTVAPTVAPIVLGNIDNSTQSTSLSAPVTPVSNKSISLSTTHSSPMISTFNTDDVIPIAPIKSPKTNISFSDSDHILDMGTNKKSVIHAPKTNERLAEISRMANIKRKQEEDGDDGDDGDDDGDDGDFDDGPLNIGGDNINLDISDIHDISKDLKINKNPILDDIEVLA
jgi:hypothetical protein